MQRGNGVEFFLDIFCPTFYPNGVTIDDDSHLGQHSVQLLIAVAFVFSNRDKHFLDQADHTLGLSIHVLALRGSKFPYKLFAIAPFLNL